MKRVAIVSPRFYGHINVLLDLWRTHETSHLFIVGFSGDLGFEQTKEDRITTIEVNQTSPSPVASDFNAARAARTTDELIVRLYDFNPTLVVYDFFCLEAKEAAEKLGVPAICSVPALLGSKESETCSDALLPKEHMYWLWKHPYQVAIKPVQFMGPRVWQPGTQWKSPYDAKKYSKFVYVTMGTVIPHYESCKTQLQSFLAALWNASMRCDDVFIYCAVPGAQKYASHNLVCVDSCDQLALLNQGKPNLMIFHGGGNTYSEGLQAGVPMVAYPFFGDQTETANRLGGPLELKSIHTIIQGHMPPTQKPAEPLSLPFSDCLTDYFEPGDLVFGHSRHRENLNLVLNLNGFCSWTKLSDAATELPRIADIYNDEPLELHQLPDGPYKERLRAVREARERDPHLDLPKDHRLVYYCLHIAQLTLHQWNNKIHFLIDEIEEMGPATRIELEWALEHPHTNILYYSYGQRVPTPIPRPQKPPRQPAHAIKDPHDVVKRMCTISGRIPMWYGRHKTGVSIDEKTEQRKLPVHDHEAYRITYMCRQELHLLLTCTSEYDVRVTTHQGRVIYLYYFGPKMHVEIQLWPYVYLYHFCKGLPPSQQQIDIQDAVESFF